MQKPPVALLGVVVVAALAVIGYAATRGAGSIDPQALNVCRGAVFGAEHVVSMRLSSPYGYDRTAENEERASRCVESSHEGTVPKICGRAMTTYDDAIAVAPKDRNAAATLRAEARKYADECLG